MKISVYKSSAEMAKRAAEKGAEAIRAAIAERGGARLILATGNSQVEMLGELTAQRGIDWSKTEMFHLDEYVGLAMEHPASFRRYLKERFVDVVHPRVAWLIEGDSKDLPGHLSTLNAKIKQAPIDVAFIGIGENGHLAFNDPPADFQTRVPYEVRELDRACRMQQVGEGWFPTFEDVPKKAVSMTVRQILLSRMIICTVPDRRKAQAVHDCLAEGAAVTPAHPASILKEHESAFVFLDRAAASLL